MKYFYLVVIVLNYLISNIALASTIEQGLLQLCSVIKQDLPKVSTDCVGPCSNKDGAYYQSKDLSSFFSQLEIKGIQKTCKKSRKKPREIACRCALISRPKYKNILKQSCAQDNKHIYLVNNFFQKGKNGQLIPLVNKFHDRLNKYIIIHKLLKTPLPQCLNNIDKLLPSKYQKILINTINKTDAYNISTLDDYFIDLKKRYKDVQFQLPKIPKKELQVAIDEFNPCQQISKLGFKLTQLEKTLNTDPASTGFFLSTQRNILKCLTMSKKRAKFKSRGKILKSSLQVIQKNLKIDKIETFSILKVAKNSKQPQIKLFDPTGRTITGKSIEEIAQKHKQTWVAHWLDKLTPLIIQTDEQYQEIKQQLLVENDPQKRKQLLKDLDEIEKIKGELRTTVAEIKDFHEMYSDPRITQLKNKLAQAEKRLQQSNHKSHKTKKIAQIIPSTSVTINSPAYTDWNKDNWYSKSTPTKSNTTDQNYTDSQIAISDSTHIPSHQHKGDKPNKKHVTRHQLPSTTIKHHSLSSRTGASNSKAHLTTTSHSSTPRPIATPHPKLLFSEVMQQSPKVKIMVSRLPDGALYGFVNPQEKKVKIFKKDKNKEQFVTEKTFSELQKMGINIAKNDINSLEKISFSQGKVFFEYKDGHFISAPVKSIKGVAELNSIF